MKNPPLSWQLTAGEIADLESAWALDANRRALTDYLALRNGPAAGAHACAAVP